MQDLKTINIPTQFANHVIQNNLWRPAQLLICLKGAFNDKTRITPKDLRVIANTLGVKSTKTIRNNLKKLIDLNWIGYNKVSKCYHIRSLWKITLSYGYTSRECAIFDCREILDFKAFIVAQSMGRLLNYQRKKNAAEKRKSAERNNSIRSSQTDKTNDGFFPLSCKALAQCWGKAKSHAHKMKNLAASANCIQVTIDRNQELSNWFYEMAKIGQKKQASKILTESGEAIRRPDRLMHKLHYKTRRQSFIKPKVKE